MNLLFVHPFISPAGGAQLALFWLLNGLAHRGHSIKLCVGSESGQTASQLTRLGIKVEIIQLNLIRERIRMESQGSELIVAGNYPSTDWLDPFTLKKPILWNCNEPPRALYEEAMSTHFLGSRMDPKFYFPWTKALKRQKLKKLIDRDQRVVRGFDRILAISKQTASWIQAIYGRDATVVNLGVGDMELQAQHVSPDPFIFFAPAGLEPIKNFKTVLESFAAFKTRNPSANAALWMTGEDPWRPEAERIARNLKITKDVEFLGNIPRTELINCYEKCHAVIFIPLDEPFGLVSCEAGLAGKPIIGSSHGGPAETITHEQTGILVDPLDVQKIAAAMKRLVYDRALCAQLGKNGQERISNQYGFNAYLDQFETACNLTLDRSSLVSSKS